MYTDVMKTMVTKKNYNRVVDRVSDDDGVVCARVEIEPVDFSGELWTFFRQILDFHDSVVVFACIFIFRMNIR